MSAQRSDGYRRFNRSAHVNRIRVETLADIDYDHNADFMYSAGGYKLNALKRALRKLDANKDDGNVIVMYTERYDIKSSNTFFTKC